MKRFPCGLLFGIGLLCMLSALFLQNVTLAGGKYGPTLLKALALTVAADVCFVLVIWRGDWAVKIAAGVMMLPTIFVVSDFLRRTRGAF